MADGAGLAISSSPRPIRSLLFFLLLLVAVSAAACACVASAASDVAHAGANPRLITSGRFLASVSRDKRGRHVCRPGDPGACSGGGSAAPGEQLIKCCGRACTDVLASRNNCGACGKRCPFGQLCCGGRCTAAEYDAENCGACRRACPAGLRCTYGMCGYA